MSPRAAWRLEALGFAEVYDYVAGKMDWAAEGLPTEGSSLRKVRAVDLVRRDVATCRPDETIGEVRARVASSGLGVCVVTNDEAIVFGMLREQQLSSSDEATAGAVMRPGPSTFRPNTSASDMAKYMTEHDLPSAPITSADGRLIGLLLRDDAVAHREGAPD